jgi:hypothetical protein
MPEHRPRAAHTLVRPRLFALLALSLGSLSSCTRSATGVEVSIDTDADRGGLAILRVWVSASGSMPTGDAATVDGGASSSAPLFTRPLYRSTDDPAARWPGSVVIVPAEGGPRNGEVDVLVEVQGVAHTLRRRARFRFVEGLVLSHRMVLRTSCAAASTACRTAAGCTVQRACEERGLTCGDRGECDSIIVTPIQDPVDAGVAAPRDASMDAGPTAARCNDGLCSNGETACTCPSDCSALPGDGCCSMGETVCQGEPACMDVAGDGCCGASPCVECLAGQTRCDGACVDTTSSPLHCGRCGSACTVGQLCTSSQCSSTCSAPNRECVVNGASFCIDTRTNSAHCGACGRACSAAQQCINGECLAPPACTVALSPSAVACGANTTASWRCTDVTRCEAVCNGMMYAWPCTNGVMESVELRVDTGGLICDFTGIGPLGRSTQRVAASCSPPPACTVQFTPNSVVCGAQSTASWTCSNSSTCRAVCNGMVYDFPCPSGVPGSAPLTVPVGGLSCQFTATGAGGSSTVTATAACTPPPACTVQFTPNSVVCGAQSTASWTCSNSSTCRAVCNGMVYDFPCPSGVPGSAPLTVPVGGLSCQFTATGPGGSSTVTATASCVPPPTCTVQMNPPSVVCPGTTTGEWNCRNAATCTADCGAGPVALDCPDGVTRTFPGLGVAAPSGLSCRFTATGPGGTFTTTAVATCR